MSFIKAATVQEVPPGTGKQVTLSGKAIALFHINGAFYAIDDTCPHRGGPLSEGQVEGTEVICPWHSAAFDVTTGAVLSPPANSGVASYKVQVVGDEVQVDV
jgi:3-phenylpropionate/trans-cinnamate dioxygenase ferredoxin component